MEAPESANHPTVGVLERQLVQCAHHRGVFTTEVSWAGAEAEYRVVTHALQELHQPVDKSIVVYCDNVPAVYMSANPEQHRRTKHIEIDIHFLRNKVTLGEIRLLHVPSSSQYANIFIKGLPTALFAEFRSSLNIRQAQDDTLGACWTIF